MTESYKEHFKTVIIPAVFVASLAGAVSGALIFFYRLAANYVMGYSVDIYEFMRAKPAFIPLLFVGLIAAAFMMSFVLRWAPEAAGGGIPRSEGVLKGKLRIRWVRTLIATLIGSMISYISGLSLGNEGPSVQLGTAVGAGANRTIRKKQDGERLVLTGSIAGSFAVATGAPLAGMVFAIEEANQQFSPRLLLSACCGTLWAVGVSEALAYAFGLDGRLLLIGAITTLPFKYIWYAIIIGVVCGLGASGFNKFSVSVSNLTANLKWKYKTPILLAIVFVVTGAVGLIFPDMVGGGHDLMLSIAEGGIVWYMLLAFLWIKLLLITFCAASGATGGMFVPMLVMGALFGGLLAEGGTACGIETEYYKVIVLLGICAFLGASIKAPMTAVVFIVEATGSYASTLPAVIAVAVAYAIISLLKVDSLNDTTVMRLIRVEEASL